MKIANGVAKELRHYVGAIGIFWLVIGILMFLSFNEIPNMYKDVVVSIIGMMVGALSVVIMTVIGRNLVEVNELKKQTKYLEDSKSPEVKILSRQISIIAEMLNLTNKNVIWILINIIIIMTSIIKI